MANYYGTTRTNYVAVKDASEFKKFLEDIDCEVVERDGKFAIRGGSEGEIDFCPYEVDLLDTIHEHLQDGEVLVIQHVGAEKMRYLCAWSLAIHSSGERESLRQYHGGNLLMAKIVVDLTGD